MAKFSVWAGFALCCALGCRATGTIAPSASEATARSQVNVNSLPASTAAPGVATVGEIESRPHTTTSEKNRQRTSIKLASSDEPGRIDGRPILEETISLADAVGRSLAENPDLVAMRQSDGVGSAALGVARTYPFNPSVQVQATPYQNTPEGGPGTTYHYVLLMQNLQLAHQQQFREEGATASLNTIRWNIHQAELLNVAQTQRLYLTVLYLHGIRDLARSSAANNDQLLSTLEKQLAAGNATAADVAIVRVDSRSTRQQARLAEANYQTSLRDFRRQLNLPPTEPVQPAGDLRTLKWPTVSMIMTLRDGAKIEGIEDGAHIQSDDALADEALASELAASRPDVLAARSDVDAARAALSLAVANKTPDLQLGPYYQRSVDGTTFVGFRAHMEIPVLNTGSPLERQRHAELRQRVAAWQQLHTRAAWEAQGALERYRLALENVVDDEQEPSGSLPEELHRLEEQFLAGEVDILRVMQARTSLIQNRRAKLDLLNEVAQAAANLTASAGLAAELLTAD